MLNKNVNKHIIIETIRTNSKERVYRGTIRKVRGININIQEGYKKEEEGQNYES